MGQFGGDFDSARIKQLLTNSTFIITAVGFCLFFVLFSEEKSILRSARYASHGRSISMQVQYRPRIPTRTPRAQCARRYPEYKAAVLKSGFTRTLYVIESDHFCATDFIDFAIQQQTRRTQLCSSGKEARRYSKAET